MWGGQEAAASRTSNYVHLLGCLHIIFICPYISSSYLFNIIFIFWFSLWADSRNTGLCNFKAPPPKLFGPNDLQFKQPRHLPQDRQFKQPPPHVPLHYQIHTPRGPPVEQGTQTQHVGNHFWVCNPIAGCWNWYRELDYNEMLKKVVQDMHMRGVEAG